MAFKVFTIIALLLIIILFFVFIFTFQGKAKIKIKENAISYNIRQSLYSLLITPYNNYYIYDYLILMYYNLTDSNLTNIKEN